MKLRSAIRRSDLKALAAVMLLADQGKPITVRAVGKTVGWKSPNYAAESLRRLRSKGLISFDSKQRGTTRPLVRFIPAEMLGARD